MSYELEETVLIKAVVMACREQRLTDENAFENIRNDPRVRQAFAILANTTVPMVPGGPVAWRTCGMIGDHWTPWEMCSEKRARRWMQCPSFKNGRRKVEPLYAAIPSGPGGVVAWRYRHVPYVGWSYTSTKPLRTDLEIEPLYAATPTREA